MISLPINADQHFSDFRRFVSPIYDDNSRIETAMCELSLILLYCLFGDKHGFFDRPLQDHELAAAAVVAAEAIRATCEEMIELQDLEEREIDGHARSKFAGLIALAKGFAGEIQKIEGINAIAATAADEQDECADARKDAVKRAEDRLEEMYPYAQWVLEFVRLPHDDTTTTAAEAPAGASTRQSVEAKAIGMLAMHQDWSKKEIAEAIGTNAKYLSDRRHTRFNAAWAALHACDLPLGSKSAERGIEAVGDEDLDFDEIDERLGR